MKKQPPNKKWMRYNVLVKLCGIAEPCRTLKNKLIYLGSFAPNLKEWLLLLPWVLLGRYKH